MIVTKWKRKGRWPFKKEITEVSKLPPHISDIKCLTQQEQAINSWVEKWAGRNEGWGWQVRCRKPDNCCRYEHPESIEMDCTLAR